MEAAVSGHQEDEVLGGKASFVFVFLNIGFLCKEVKSKEQHNLNVGLRHALRSSTSLRLG